MVVQSNGSENLLDWGRVYAEHAPQVRRVLARHGVSAADLDDLCHDVFLIARRKAAAMPDIGCVSLWLRAIAWKVVAGHRRRARARRELLDPASADGPTPAPNSSPEALLEQAETAANFYRALGTMDFAHQDAACLQLVGHLTTTEIARVSGCDRKTVTKRLRAAHRALERRMTGRFEKHAPPARSPSAAVGQPAARARASGDDRLAVYEGPACWVGATQGAVVAIGWGGVSLDALDRAAAAWEGLGRRVPRALVVIPRARGHVPSVRVRARLVSLLQRLDPEISALAGVFTDVLDRSRLVPVLRSVLAISRPSYPCALFTDFSECRQWLSSHRSDGCAPIPDRLAAAVRAVLREHPKSAELEP